MKRHAFISPLIKTKRKPIERPSVNGPCLPANPKTSNKVMPVNTPLKSDSSESEYWRVMWRKMTGKDKKKLCDGLLSIVGRVFTLYDMEHKKLSSQTLFLKAADREMKEGQFVEFANKSIELMQPVSPEEWRSGSVFTEETGTRITSKAPHIPKAKSKVASVWPELAQVDSFLSRVLKPHQLDAIQFMYDCLRGFDNDYYGCILADQMGLGKTLSVISLIWTLTHRVGRKLPLIGKVLVFVPVSLIKTWEKEFLKWVGRERLKPLILTSTVSKEKRIAVLNDFYQNTRNSVLILSYETLRQKDLYESLKSCPDIGLICCDEGHRLKNCNSQTNQLLNSLRTKRRIVITGTPVQNNLSEFFAVVDFVNPGILGNASTFNRVYGAVISRGQDASATSAELSLAADRCSALTSRLEKFIIRRTSEVLKAILPQKSEYVLFLRPSPLQLEFYAGLIETFKEYNSELSSDPLSLIMALRKCSTHPKLLLEGSMNEIFSEDDKKQLESIQLFELPKFAVIKRILETALAVGEKVVFVSNFTSTLDLVELGLNEIEVPFLRLDGSTASDKRDEIVSNFNSKSSTYNVFILSSKSGGVGLTLVAANHLVLIDSSFNPSDDAQALARVYRYGQTKETKLYRLVTTGTIEEKIFQRHQFKQSLSNAVVDLLNSDDRNFSRNEMKDLFQFEIIDQGCTTWNIIQKGQKKDVFMYEPYNKTLYTETNELCSFIMKRKEDFS
ncbi:hypothetical protein P9112_012683 [Eukaryota sp. TZLM1-RC]